jgi:secreted Zn-dependent insulinase-like peptidase
LEESYWTFLDKQNALADLNLTHMLHFIQVVKEHMMVEGLVQGNITAAQAGEMLDFILEAFQCKPIIKNNHPYVSA